MKAVGIIAEYNPFHSGHAYQIRRAKELSGADYAVVVMSPDFVQRGSCAIIDKWSRARMALLGGADIVLEMPVVFASASAEYFAEGGVSLLSALNAVDCLSFGCETDDTDALMDAACFFEKIRGKEPEGYSRILQARLKDGMTYPKARADAYLAYRDLSGQDSCPSPVPSTSPEAPSAFQDEKPSSVSDLLSLPNNILAIEYKKAALRLHSGLKMLPVKRLGEGYHASSVPAQAPEGFLPDAGPSPAAQPGFLSAESIRRILREGRQLPESALPESSRKLLLDASSRGELLSDNDFSLLLQIRLTELASQEAGDLNPRPASTLRLSDFLDVTPDLENRIRNCIDEYQSFEQFVSLVRTKQMTETRIRRALLHILLGITKEETGRCRKVFQAGCHEETSAGASSRQTGYARLLGFRKSAGPLLKKIRKDSAVPLVTNVPDALHRSAQDGSSLLSPEAAVMLRRTLYSSRICNIALQNKTGRLPVSEYRRQPVIV